MTGDKSPYHSRPGSERYRLFSPIIRLYSRIHHVNIRDERSVGEQVRSGLRLAGWILLTFAVATQRKDPVGQKRSEPAQDCGRMRPDTGCNSNVR